MFYFQAMKEWADDIDSRTTTRFFGSMKKCNEKVPMIFSNSGNSDFYRTIINMEFFFSF